jgi:hypothetical protein
MIFTNRSAVLSALLLVAAWEPSLAFVPSTPRNLAATRASTASAMLSPVPKGPFSSNNFQMAKRQQFSALQMAASDFDEGKYTEAAWSGIASLTKVAEYYQSSAVEAPMLLDVILNPGKHSAGDDAEAAKKVAEKILTSAGVDVKELRQQLEGFWGNQPKMSGSTGQKTMGRTLPNVLETARQNMSVLGVSVILLILDLGFLIEVVTISVVSHTF